MFKIFNMLLCVCVIMCKPFTQVIKILILIRFDYLYTHYIPASTYITHLYTNMYVHNTIYLVIFVRGKFW